jgi:hypothetical protein
MTRKNKKIRRIRIKNDKVDIKRIFVRIMEYRGLDRAAARYWEHVGDKGDAWKRRYAQ